MIHIDGIGISGYRGFGEEVVRIGPFGKLNLFIGKNNTGKSTILHFIESVYGNAVRRSGIAFKGDDLHKGLAPGKRVVELGLLLGGDNFKALLEIHKESLILTSRMPEMILKFLRKIEIVDENDIGWFRYNQSGIKAFDPQWLSSAWENGQYAGYGALYDLLNRRTIGNGSSGMDPFVDLLVSVSLGFINRAPEVFFIGAIRDVGKGQGEAFNYSGRGIVQKLQQLQGADQDREHSKVKYDRVVRCVRTILADNEVCVQPAWNCSDIYLEWPNKSLPLAHVGTGVHEVLILGMAATMIENSVVCIEEPELHAHPELQKRLMRYLVEETDNQYFISTHSAHILDTPEAAVFHVRVMDGQCAVENVAADCERVRICNDLGYHPSDLLQSNCVIWVEGPSDRIYINYWISQVDGEMVEGIHYSIMFYGGRLLSHLTGQETSEIREDEVEQLIALRRINQHSAIVIDSDKNNDSDGVNATKARVVSEFGQEPGLAWITEGREIENYIEAGVLEEAVKDVHRNVKGLTETGKYADQTKYTVQNEKKKEVKNMNKVKVARKVVEKGGLLDVLDLEVRIEELVKFIRTSNGLEDG